LLKGTLEERKEFYKARRMTHGGEAAAALTAGPTDAAAAGG